MTNTLSAPKRLSEIDDDDHIIVFRCSHCGKTEELRDKWDLLLMLTTTFADCPDDAEVAVLIQRADPETTQSVH